MEILIVFVLFIGAFIAIVVHRGMQMKKLAHDGVVADGKVINKSRRAGAQAKMSTPYLRYEFYAANGFRYERNVAVGENVYESHEEGDAIGVVYLKDNPKVSAARYMVNLSREALKLPPL